jgi:hypothetical protein
MASLVQQPLGVDENALRSFVSLVLVPSRPAYFILIKSSTRRNWVLVRIDSKTGALNFSFTKGKDIFQTDVGAAEGRGCCGGEAMGKCRSPCTWGANSHARPCTQPTPCRRKRWTTSESGGAR